MDKNMAKHMEQFRETVAKTGEDVVFRIFPQKIIALGELLATWNDPSSPYHTSNALKSTDPTVYPTSDSSAEPSVSKKRKLEDGDSQPATSASPATSSNPKYTERVKANEHINTQVYGRLKSECEDLILHTDQVRLWVTMTLPRIEDGDNFGVQVQEEVLGELQRAQESAFGMRDLSRKDHLARAKICSKLIKYPNVEDYVHALREHDEKQFYYARQHLYDIRNVYAAIADMMHKNIAKIRAPKNNNSVALY